MALRRPNGGRRRAAGARPRDARALARRAGRRWQTRPYYPAILDIAGRARARGRRRQGRRGQDRRALLNAGAQVKVVSLDRDATRCSDWARGGHDRAASCAAYESSDLDGRFLVIAATEDNDTNVRVFEDAEAAPDALQRRRRHPPVQLHPALDRAPRRPRDRGLDRRREPRAGAPHPDLARRSATATSTRSRWSCSARCARS